MARRARINVKRRNRRIVWLSVVAGIAMLVVVLALIVQSTTSNPYVSFIGQPVSQPILRAVTGVNDSTLSAVGTVSSVVAPQTISGSPLAANGKPEVLYIGGDYCPYCAVERWSLIVALSKFGNFSGLLYMQSSSTDANANTPTFTFSNATYSSKYITFVAVEEFDRSGNIRQQLTTEQQSLISQYDNTGSIPFVDFANSYMVTGAQSTLDISGQSWTQVAGQLGNPSTPVAKNILGAANYMISAICKIDGGQPGSVCGQSYATLPVSFATGGGMPAVAAAETAPFIGWDARWTD